VDDRTVTELETAIADVGALLVRAGRYTRGAGAEGRALLRATHDLGDTARRLHHRDALDADQAARLRSLADSLAGRVRALLADIEASLQYRTAVAAHAAGDQATLAGVITAVFADVEPVPTPPALWAHVAWLRRGRPRTVEDVVGEIRDRVRDGFAAEGDDLAPGADPRLPAVVLGAEPPAEEPIACRLDGAAVRVPLYRVEPTGELLAYTPRLVAPLAVRLATSPPEDQPRLEVDFAAWRTALAAALAAASVPLDPADGD
jgi:hypothetical protein